MINQLNSNIMIQTNTTDRGSLQNIIKFYVKALIDNVNPELIGKKTILIDLSDNKIAAHTYRTFKRSGDKMQLPLARAFRKYVEPSYLKGDELDQFRLTDVNKFISFFTNPYTIGLITDYIEENHKEYVLKVKYNKDASPTFAEIVKANKYFKTTGKTITWCNPDLAGLNALMETLESPEEISNYWVCRTMNGNAPAMLVECSSFNSDGTPNWSDKTEANHICSIYSAYTKTKYFDARPCSYDYWNENEDVRFSTAE